MTDAATSLRHQGQTVAEKPAVQFEDGSRFVTDWFSVEPVEMEERRKAKKLARLAALP